MDLVLQQRIGYVVDASSSGPGTRRRSPVPDHLAPVLAQLLTGVPDATASRKLNMSPRTFSRRVAELLDHIGVESRFQAGVEAVRRGWIPQILEPSHRSARGDHLRMPVRR